MSEKENQNKIWIALSNAGLLIWRNTIGMVKMPNGSMIRYGLCNPGGSDLIGITPVVVTQEMVGTTIGVFTAVEVKDFGKKARPEQGNFIQAIKSKGGYAGVAVTPEEALKIITRGEAAHTEHT